MVAAVAIAAVIGLAGAWAASTVQPSGVNPRKLAEPTSTERLFASTSSRFCGWLGARCVGWLGARCVGWFLGWFYWALVVAVVTPLILHAAAWEATAGKFGIGMLTQTGARVTAGDTYGVFAGFVATAWLHGLHGGAMVGLATLLGISRLPRSIREQACLDAGPWRRWWRVLLPLAAPWWTVALLATAGLAATEMTVADLYGYRTIADEFYRFFAVEPTLPSILVTCFLPMVLAATIVTYVFVSRRRIAYANAFREPHVDVDVVVDRAGGMTRFVAVVVMVVIAGLLVLIPLLGLINNIGQVVVRSGDDVEVAWSLKMALSRLWEAPRLFAAEYRWTTIISVASSVASLAIAWPLAAWVRRRARAAVGVDAMMVALICVPGPIAGLMVVHLFQFEVPGFRFLYQQTILPTMIALSFRTLPITYWLVKAGYVGIETSTLELAAMETTPLKSFWFIERPLLMRSLVLAGVAAAVASSGDLPATLPVVPAGVTTVAVRLFGLLHSGARYQEAALSLWYLAALFIVTRIAIRKL
ncbi:hypothetical protein Pla22_30920 [Rubripirellula amarantea]|uniref:ABC transmembrane type-1 domain-containing protein n=2 Tax=Rubripirellula amarantea TaxID=2527999 RepID=A0A5C5WI48_9BACT|nr:hypothetical protein Pla22_30920 [Rubripirellula amarantea]